MGPTNEMCNLCVHACMTQWAFRVNTPGAAGVLTRNVVLHLFSVGFPHVSVGGIFGNHWRLSSAWSLFQRAIKPLFKGLWFPKMPGVSCNTFPQWQNGFQARPHVSAANALVQHFPSFRWLAGIRFPDGWRGPDRQWSYRRCTWTPQSAWQKNTSINQHEKRHLQNLTCQQSDFFWKSTINHDMVTVGTGCLLPLLFWPTHCNSSVLSLQVEVNSLMSFLRSLN